jgi:hypothetical protein
VAIVLLPKPVKKYNIIFFKQSFLKKFAQALNIQGNYLEKLELLGVIFVIETVGAKNN